MSCSCWTELEGGGVAAAAMVITISMRKYGFRTYLLDPKRFRIYLLDPKGFRTYLLDPKRFSYLLDPQAKVHVAYYLSNI